MPNFRRQSQARHIEMSMNNEEAPSKKASPEMAWHFATPPVFFAAPNIAATLAPVVACRNA
jgi:hypothetical protein